MLLKFLKGLCQRCIIYKKWYVWIGLDKDIMCRLFKKVSTVPLNAYKFLKFLWLNAESIWIWHLISEHILYLALYILTIVLVSYWLVIPLIVYY